MKISAVATRCAVNVQTIRFYERRGLLRDPRSGVGGYRDYDECDVERLQFIRQAQTLGFSLREVGELLAVRARSGSAAEVMARAKSTLDTVRAKLASLRRLERSLVRLVAACPGRGPLELCPIVQEFERAPNVAHRAPAGAARRRHQNWKKRSS